VSASKISLYKRLGGYDAIAEFVDNLLPRLRNDLELGVYWKGHSRNSLRTERQLTVDYLCEISGGPVYYRGRDMKVAHDGLDISEPDWSIFIKHFEDCLDSLDIQGKDRYDCMTIVEDIENVIIENA
jgi:hemoglobin